MGSLTIHPMHVGSLTKEMSTFTYMRNIGRKITFPVLAWYIAGADASILVDTGAPPPAEVPLGADNYEQPPEQSLERGLAGLGVSPDEIELVVLTHLHWDHCLNAHLFPRARFVVQRAELQYAAAPLPVHWRTYRVRQPSTRALLPAESKVQVVSGDVPLTRGVALAHLPGHTPGLQGVTVETAVGTYLLASDNVPFYENWEGEPPDLPHIPSDLHVDLEAYFQSLARMERLADCVLPGHDPKVLERKAYG